MVQVGRSTAGIGGTTKQYIDPTQVEKFVDLEFIIDQIQEIETEEVNEEKRELIRLFSEGVKRMEEGFDPGNFGEWFLEERRNDSEDRE